MKLYELAENYQHVLELMEDPDEYDPEALRDTLEALNDSVNDKLDGLSGIYKSLVADIQAISDEAKRLKARAEQKQRRAEWIKDYLLANMQMLGKRKFESARNVITLPKPKPSLEVRDEFIEWAERNHEDFLKYKTPEVDKVKVKEAIMHGEEVVGAELVYKQTISIK